MTYNKRDPILKGPMMSSPRYLTKSRFKLGKDCPTKLFYTNKKEYPNQNMDDPFLEALADGGYQVGELAKCYYPDGVDVSTLDYEEALRQTNELLKNENVVIFEPAIRVNNLFIRIDILVKIGNSFELIEVKAKSFDPEKENQFLNKNGTIVSTWLPYFYDIAFQYYVLKQSFPNSQIEPYLMLADKSIPCGSEGLNQKFKIVRDASNRKGVKVSANLSKEDLTPKILTKVSALEMIELIFDGKETKDLKTRSFVEEVNYFAKMYEKDEKILSPIGSHCKSCEFTCTTLEEKEKFKNGFKECWSSKLNWKDSDFLEPNVLEVWSSRRKDKWIEEGKIKLTDLCEEDIGPSSKGEPGLSASQRQWLQVEMAQKKSSDFFLDKHGLKMEMNSWKFPLHFIDFETSMVAIPFNKGRRPYEAIAFQFSHHIVDEEGRVEHRGQYLSTKKGAFPNYDFIRALKKELDQDEGTIFRYSPHENTYLNLIYRQLIIDQNPIADKNELIEFIKSITYSSEGGLERWDGERCMVDLWEMVKSYYYDPAMRGSNSIKHVLPAILNSSDYLKEKYSKPIYGSIHGIKSLNFSDWVWIYEKEGRIQDPYERLPKLFQDVSDHDFKILSYEDELRNGGAALSAYARMQFSEMSDYEYKELSAALLKYCELDTLAMVMIYEAWREWVK
jgi:hypothetical protein